MKAAVIETFGKPGVVTLGEASLRPLGPDEALVRIEAAGQLRRGQRVLVHAAAGGVGSMAVQQAHHAGAYVIATASSGNHALLRELGVDEAIDYRTEDFARVRNVDLVLDTIGGETLERSWSVLGPKGRIASLVEFGIEPRNGRVGEFVFFTRATPFLPEAMRLFEAGQLQIVIDAIVGFDKTRSALEKLAAAHVRGKVIVRLRR